MKNKLKILLVLDCYRPNIDGPVLCIDNYAKCLSKSHNCEVDIMVPSYPKYKDEEGITIHRIFSIKGTEGYRTPLPIFSKKARKIFKQNKYDIVHINSPFTLGRFAAKMAKKYNIPCVCTVHTQYKSDFERKLKSKFLQNFMLKYVVKTMNMSNKLLTVSNGAKAAMQSYGVTKEITVLRNGTELLYPKNDKELIDLVNQKYNLANEEMLFLFVGRLVENKNIQFSLRVLKILKEKGYNNFKFIIVGSGPFENGLKKLTQEYNLADNVVFTGLVRDRNELSGLYLRSDLFMFPSVFDTFGLVVLEAATMKTPTFVIKGSCAGECITNDVNGFAEVEDENLWAEKIKKCLNDKSILTSLGETAYKTIYQSWDDITAKLYKIYLEVIDKN